MFAIGNEELKKLKPIGKTVKCPSCQKRHRIKFPTDLAGKEVTDLGFVECGGETYLVSVAGKELNP